MFRAWLLCVHEELLECFELLIHRNALLCSFHEGCQTLWNSNLCRQDFIYFILEFCRMCRFKKEAGFAWLQLFFQCLLAAGTMRIENIIC